MSGCDRPEPEREWWKGREHPVRANALERIVSSGIAVPKVMSDLSSALWKLVCVQMVEEKGRIPLETRAIQSEHDEGRGQSP